MSFRENLQHAVFYLPLDHGRCINALMAETRQNAIIRKFASLIYRRDGTFCYDLAAVLSITPIAKTRPHLSENLMAKVGVRMPRSRGSFDPQNAHLQRAVDFAGSPGIEDRRLSLEWFVSLDAYSKIGVFRNS